MQKSEDFFQASDNIKLFYRIWLPAISVKAVIAIVHGSGDHSGRYESVANALVSKGYKVYAFDLKGHGKSPGKRGHINNWQEYREDLRVFLQLVQNKNPGKPIIPFGHSMGGVIVLDYCLHEPEFVDKVICTSPAIGKLGISPVLFWIAKMLDNISPSLVLPTGLDVTKFSRVENFDKKTLADPLFHRKATPRFGMEMNKTVEFIHAHTGEFRLPLYLIHGTGDEIASIEGSRKFVRNLKYDNYTYKEYEGGYHELFNDLVKEEVLEDMVEWLDKI